MMYPCHAHVQADHVTQPEVSPVVEALPGRVRGDVLDAAGVVDGLEVDLVEALGPKGHAGHVKRLQGGCAAGNALESNSCAFL